MIASGGFLPVRLQARKCRDRTLGSRPGLAEAIGLLLGVRGTASDMRIRVLHEVMIIFGRVYRS
jgi:hypothetical protein